MGSLLHKTRSLLAIVVAAIVTVTGTAESQSARTPAIGIHNAINDNELYPILDSPVDTTYLARYHFASGSVCAEKGWTSVDLTAGSGDFGDFAALYPASSILKTDLCAYVEGCVWGFFDESAGNYACGGYPEQSVVPYGGPEGYIHNEIWSPRIPITGSGSEFLLSFDVYRDLGLDALVFYTWRIRSYTNGIPGEWCDRRTVFYDVTSSSYGDWFRHQAFLGDLIPPGADEVQIALGVIDMCAQWCGILGSGACHSHSPVFSDVELMRLGRNGPQWYADPVDLFQDNFAADGTATGTVRVDMARDINPRTTLNIRPGDSLVVWVGEPTVGLDYHSTVVPSSGPAVYLHVRDVSGEKSGPVISGDPLRWPVVSLGGGWTVVQCDSVRTPEGTVPGRFCVDLNDELYTPGDEISYYLSARDKNGIVTYWSQSFGTTSSGPEIVDYPMEMTCLPIPGTGLRKILYVDDTDMRNAQPFFDTSFMGLDILDQVDRFDVKGADRLAGNGLGSRVVDVERQLIPFYKYIIWNSGNLPNGTIGDGTGRPEKSPDAQVLAEFLRLNDRRGGLYISGDDVASELATLSGAGAADLRRFINYTVADDNHVDMGVGINPAVQGTVGSMFYEYPNADIMVAYGGCPEINSFDVIVAQGNAKEEANYFRDGPAPSGTGTSSAIISQRTRNDLGYEQGVVLSGFSFHYIRNIGPGFVPSRYLHLDRIIDWLENFPDFPCTASKVGATQVENGIKVTWWIDNNCYGYPAYRVYRVVAGDTTLAGETGGEARSFVDEHPVGGTANAFFVQGQENTSAWRVIGETNLFVKSNLPYSLGQNYPNPFQHTASFGFTIPVGGRVNIKVYDVGGRKVATVVDRVFSPAGYYEVDWSARADDGSRLPSGVYFYRMFAAGNTFTRKLVIVK